jgi:hypothetical protein
MSQRADGPKEIYQQASREWLRHASHNTVSGHLPIADDRENPVMPLLLCTLHPCALTEEQFQDYADAVAAIRYR